MGSSIKLTFIKAPDPNGRGADRRGVQDGEDGAARPAHPPSWGQGRPSDQAHCLQLALLLLLKNGHFWLQHMSSLSTPSLPSLFTTYRAANKNPCLCAPRSGPSPPNLIDLRASVPHQRPPSWKQYTAVCLRSVKLNDPHSAWVVLRVPPQGGCALCWFLQQSGCAQLSQLTSFDRGSGDGSPLRGPGPRKRQFLNGDMVGGRNPIQSN